MEDSKKKLVMILVVVVCLGAAGAVFMGTGRSGSGSIDDISDEKTTWVKCMNKKCNAEYQMGLKEFYKAVQATNTSPMAQVTPALTCKECGERSVYKAVKCQNPACGIVFREGSVPNDFQDRCPKCKQSATEEIRKARQKGTS
ncbi:MAG: hypothetical protein JW837_17305 [Sedimentisphaerales bacterium]|nr:hypothetical protein [Sedimentisphaerales bacterium]